MQATRAEAEARRARAEAKKAEAEARRAEAEAKSAKAKAHARYFDSEAFDPHRLSMSFRDRQLLIKALGMLGSNFDGEVINAARIVERQRSKLGLTWDGLIIPAAEAISKILAKRIVGDR